MNTKRLNLLKIKSLFFAMKLKHKVILWKKEYLVWELTVGLYLIFLQDFEQFIHELFLEFNSDIPKIEEIKMQFFLEEYFEQKSNIRSRNQKSKEEIYEIILINIWRFIKHIWGNYTDICNTPMKVFSFILWKMDVIYWEKEFVFSQDEQKVGRRKIKDLFDNQK